MIVAVYPCENQRAYLFVFLSHGWMHTPQLNDSMGCVELDVSFRSKCLHLQSHGRHYLEYGVTRSIENRNHKERVSSVFTRSNGKTWSISDPIFTMLSRVSRPSLLHRCSRQRSASRVLQRSSSTYEVPFISPKLTHSYYYNSMSVPLLYHSLGRHLDILAESHANHQCYAFKSEGNTRYTYRSFVDEVNALATSLIDLGFEKGDRIGVWLPNTSESCVLTYAASKVGLIKVGKPRSLLTRTFQNVCLRWTSILPSWNVNWLTVWPELDAKV